MKNVKHCTLQTTSWESLTQNYKFLILDLDDKYYAFLIYILCHKALSFYNKNLLMTTEKNVKHVHVKFIVTMLNNVHHQHC